MKMKKPSKNRSNRSGLNILLLKCPMKCTLFCFGILENIRQTAQLVKGICRSSKNGQIYEPYVEFWQYWMTGRRYFTMDSQIRLPLGSAFKHLHHEKAFFLTGYYRHHFGQ